MGIAFQLKDDLLDAFGNLDEFGKQIGGDILANKKTFLYLKALQLANESQQEDLHNFFNTNKEKETKVISVKAIFTDLDIPKHTKDMMKAYYIKAMKHLEAIDSDNKAPLIRFSEKLIDRTI